jgi:nucleoside-diphosphate-sugar epimerase
LTNLHWIQLIANELEVEAKIQTIPVWMIKMLGLFIPVMREFPEMIYQYEQDYLLDSTKFEKRFGMSATAPKDGIKILIENLKRQNASR